MFKIALYTSLIMATAGLLFQARRFTKKSGLFKMGAQYIRVPKLKPALNIKSAVLNTIFQTKLFCASKYRWAVHFLVFSGFVYLLFFHALDELTSFDLFEYYQPTLDPFQFLRNLAGFLVLAGCLGFLFKRFSSIRINQDKEIKRKGFFPIILVMLVIISGFMLEAVKIISEPAFMEMVEAYSDIDEDTELNALAGYWEKNYQLTIKKTVPLTAESLKKGRLLNSEYCLDCHSKIKSAFVSKAVAGSLGKIGNFLNHHRADNWLYPIHYLLSFFMIICLPFSRFSHILLIPFASARQKMTKEHFKKETVFIHPATLAACTNCGLCSEVCSVYPHFLITRNKQVLPQYKIESAQKMIHSFQMKPNVLNQLGQGNDECTMCHRCTDICPSGIDLQGLWETLSQTLHKKGYVDNYTFVKQTPFLDQAKTVVQKKPVTISQNLPQSLADHIDHFENCVQCTICTNVCPIVAYDPDHNDYTPQQIMNLLRLGKKRTAASTRMVWNCLTCYSCQEHCPGEIKVTDIMLELQNISNHTTEILKINKLTDIGDTP